MSKYRKVEKINIFWLELVARRAENWFSFNEKDCFLWPSAIKKPIHIRLKIKTRLKLNPYNIKSIFTYISTCGLSMLFQWFGGFTYVNVNERHRIFIKLILQEAVEGSERSYSMPFAVEVIQINFIHLEILWINK